MFPTGKENPLEVFSKWLDEAKSCTDIKEPNAMALATCAQDGNSFAPSCRFVLLKNFDERGFVFFTNKNSRKGDELKDNPHAALCFYWEALGKQVRIEGKVEEVDESESDTYHTSRRRGSQIGAWASKQSQPLENYSILEQRVKKMEEEFADAPVPRPPFWGGYRVIPNRIEFWQHMEHRLHYRLLYKRIENDENTALWDSEFLYP